MPRIPSANSDFAKVEVPSGGTTGYVHPAEIKRGGIPMAFQVTSPFDMTKVLLPHALVLHVNPSNLQMSESHKIERIPTLGGYVEQHWRSELTEISADGSTGAFLNLYTGLSSVLRQRTIAWDRYRDLHDLFFHNGSLIDPAGQIVLQGNIMLMYDRGTFIGTFRTFQVEETDDSPFAFHVSWTFKVEHTITLMSSAVDIQARSPVFQSRNTTRVIR